MSEKSNNQSKELVMKDDDKEAGIKKVLELLTKGGDFSDSEIEEFYELRNKKELTTKEKERKEELKLEISKANGLKNGLWAANLSHGTYYKFLSTTRGMIVKEYDCKTPIELMLADRIVGNYWRSMKLDTIFNHLIEKEDGGYTFNDSKMNVIRELSKGLESASRQLNTSIMLLKELKQPSLNVKVKNAIIGQNQQFNMNGRNAPPEDEIIEPK